MQTQTGLTQTYLLVLSNNVLEQFLVDLAVIPVLAEVHSVYLLSFDVFGNVGGVDLPEG